MEEKISNFENHLSKQAFTYGETTIKFTDLYKMVKNSNFNIKHYSIRSSNEDYFILTQVLDNAVFFFFNYLIDLKLYNIKEKITENFEICSTYQIYEIMKSKGDFQFFYEDEKIIKYNIVPQMIQQKELILNIYEMKLDKVQFNESFFYSETTNFSPTDFTENFYSYFPEHKKSDKIKYIDSNKRKNFQEFIQRYLSKKKIIKLTGPSGIGKSFFLLYLSRTSFKYLYLNMASLNYLAKKKELIKLLNMIISEINRLNIPPKIYDKLNAFFEKIKDLNLGKIITKLIKFFIKKKLEITVILDQYKQKYFADWKNIEDSINKNEKELNFIICSSINDHLIRDSCIKVFDCVFKNKIEPKIKIQDIDEYIYISNLFDDIDLNNFYDYTDNIDNFEIKKIVCEYFNHLPKYVFKIMKSTDVELTVKSIEEGIIDKLKDFYQIGCDEIGLKLSKLRRYIGCKLKIDDFSKITTNFSFKYFCIKFFKDDEEITIITPNVEINYFQIDYLFIYMAEIIEDLAIRVNDIFFTNLLYKNHTGSTIGGFLELITIDKIKNKVISLPNGNIDYFICVDRINEMKEIKPKMNELLSNKLKLLELDNDKINNPQSSEDINNIKIKDLFISSIPLAFRKSELIKFEEKYLLEESKINQIKMNYLNKNNIQIRDNEGNLLLTNKLFSTQIKNNNINLPGNIKDYEKYHALKNKNILITQFYENTAAYDLAYLFGNSEKKIFVGFQMKSYRDYDEHVRTFNISKKDIIEHSELLLINSAFIFGVNIVEIHYIIVGLYFQDEKEGEITYSNDLIKFCNENKFQLILYDPLKKVFLDSNKNIITSITIPDKFTNLLEEETANFFDEIPIYSPKYDFLQRKTKPILMEELAEFTQTYKHGDITDTKPQIIINDISLFLDAIKEQLGISEIKYIGNNKLKNESYLPIPTSGFIFVFYKKNHKDLKNMDKFVCLRKNKEKTKTLLYDFQEKKDLDDDILEYYKRFDGKKNYYIFKSK